MVMNKPSHLLAPVSTSCFPNAINVTSAIRPTLQASQGWVKGVALACLCSARIASGVSLLGLSSFALPVHSTLIGTVQAADIQATNIQNKSALYVPPPDAGTPHPTGGTGSNFRGDV